VARFHATLGLNSAGFVGGMGAANAQAMGLRRTLVGAAGLGVALIGIQAGIAGVSAIIGGSMSNVRDYETAFVGIRKTVNATEEEFVLLDKAIRGMAKSMPIGRIELARIGQVAGQLGIRGVDDLSKFIETMAKIGVTTDLTSEEAAIGFARFSNIMGEPINQIENLASTVVQLGNNFATFEPEILSFAQRIAGAGAIVGFTADEVLALSATLPSLGVQAEAGGTAMQRALLAIDGFVATTGSELELLGTLTGQTADQFAEAWETDAAGAFQQFVEGLSNAGDSVLPVLQELGLGAVRSARSFLVLAQNPELLSKAFKMAAAEVVNDANAMNTEAARAFDTTNSEVTRFKNNVVELSDVIGEKLVAALDKVLPPLTNFVEKLATALKDPEVDFFTPEQRADGRKAGAAGVGAGVGFGLAGPVGAAVGGIGGVLVETLGEDLRDLFFSKDPAGLDAFAAGQKAIRDAQAQRQSFGPNRPPAPTGIGAIDLTGLVDGEIGDAFDDLLTVMNDNGPSARDTADALAALLTESDGLTKAAEDAARAEAILKQARENAVSHIEDTMTTRLVAAFIEGGDEAVAVQRLSNAALLKEFEAKRDGIEALTGDIADFTFDMWLGMRDASQTKAAEIKAIFEGMLTSAGQLVAQAAGGSLSASGLNQFIASAGIPNEVANTLFNAIGPESSQADLQNILNFISDFLASNPPEMAHGGIVRARAGGSVVRVGEGGRDEAIIPLPAGSLTGGTTVNVFAGVVGSEEDVVDAVKDGIITLREQGFEV
tara:strand:+ start:1576 stop:3897 length:2322 start_codon:yes stop_codon:yes gene_type:complete